MCIMGLKIIMNNNQSDLMDLLNIISFYISLKNLDLNISQKDLQQETKRLDNLVDEKIQYALSELQSHLQEQDRKINLILKELGIKEEQSNG